MRLLFLFIYFFPLIGYCQIPEVKILNSGSISSFRGLSVVDDSLIWVSGTLGTVCKSNNGGKSFNCQSINGFENSDFRSVYAFNDKKVILANVGSPAQMILTVDGGNSWKVVYENFHPDAFIDGIDFWNDLEGIVCGDPINGKMLLISTNDGGMTWNELADTARPDLIHGEAIFAASGTTIRCFESNKVIIATGGKASRLLISNDKGKSWNSTGTPMLQGEEGQGVFSFDFRNETDGVIVGGDYKNDSLSVDHVFYSSDSGNHWLHPTTPTRGYRECVVYVNQNQLFATGPGGIDISIDGGVNWFPFSDEKGFHVIRKARNGEIVVLAGAEGRLGLITK